jgi:(1->4)-alpha-D-glucan 1-alpha-D-glucosylmutase
VIERAVLLAKRRNPASDPSVFDFIRDVLLLRDVPGLTDGQRAERCAFSMKFQQLTGPVMAKGVEDTALYIYNRLVALNEVGGDPDTFGIRPEEFHRQCLERQRRWPHALLASSTHDTKRSEDVRLRIAVLSELPREWRAALTRWRRLNRKHARRVEAMIAPSANDEYLLYQTLLGTWPFGVDVPSDDYVERIVQFMIKAAREAQVQTSWINPNEEYEEALRSFVQAVLRPATGRAFLAAMAPLRRRVARAGSVNSLSALLLKCTAPGVPDFYQGTEMWDFSLVDPDNRRPIDFALRARLLRQLRRRRPSVALAQELLDAWEDGRVKLYVTLQALACRRELPQLFAHGSYEPLDVQGQHATRVIAFARRFHDATVIVAVPRLIAGMLPDSDAFPLGPEVWGDTRIMLPADMPGITVRNRLTGERVAPGAHEPHALACADLFSVFPVALLHGSAAGERA